MAQPAMDALGAFTYLTDNLPTWITRVSDLAKHIATKHAEYSAAFKKLSAGKRSRPRRRKNSSICSIHTDDDVLVAVKQAATELEQTQGKGTTDAAVVDDTPAQDEPYGKNPRKRGADEAPSLSSDDDGDNDLEVELVCTRHNVVIDYDGHTQKALEDIVRKIGTARNNLRKGKMASLRPSFRTGLMGGLGDGPEALLSGIRSSRVRGPVSASQNGMPFDMAEKQLELVHSLCETAAHQVLRVGHCETELDAVKEKFMSLLKMAKAEVERLKRQQKPPVPEKTVEKPSTSSQPAKPAAAEKDSKSPSSNAIEVDDDTAESEECVDVSDFRAARRVRA